MLLIATLARPLAQVSALPILSYIVIYSSNGDVIGVGVALDCRLPEPSRPLVFRQQSTPVLYCSVSGIIYIYMYHEVRSDIYDISTYHIIRSIYILYDKCICSNI